MAYYIYIGSWFHCWNVQRLMVIPPVSPRRALILKIEDRVAEISGAARHQDETALVGTLHRRGAGDTRAIHGGQMGIPVIMG